MRITNLPKYITEYYRKLEDQNDSLNKTLQEVLQNLKKNFKENKICILPSFYKLLIYLRKNKIEFGIIFRTFGNDLNLISQEFNYFINGLHPMYSGKNGTSLIKFDVGKIPRNFNLVKKNFGSYFRKNNGYNGTFLFKGNFLERKEMEDFRNHRDFEGNQDVVKLESFNEIFLEKKESLKKNATLAYKDDWNFLKDNFSIDKPHFSGKLFLLDKSDFETLEIFFDDDVGEKNDNLIDIWDVYQKTRIPYKEAKDKFLHKVDTVQAILDQDYFIKALNNAISLREKDMVSYKENRNIILEEKLKKVNEMKEYLKNCKGSEYLQKTVFPILEPAFKILEKEKPNNPIEFLSVYLLQNKNRI